MCHSNIISSQAPPVGVLSRLIFYNNSGETNTGETSTGEVLTDSGMTLEGRLLYDKNGNMIGNILNNKREYTYDYNNRLIQINRYNEVTGKEVLITLTYDSLGRRISKKVGNQLIEYIYSGNEFIIREEFFIFYH